MFLWKSVNLKGCKVLSMAKECFLKGFAGLRNIPLPHNEEITVGRADINNPSDKLVSRKHLSFTADYANKTAVLNILGANCSMWNGYLVEQRAKCICRNGDVIEIICGSYPYELCFEEEKSQEDGETNPKRRKLNEDQKDVTSQNGHGSTVSQTWSEKDNRKLLVFNNIDLQGSTKIAAFDIDGTIINTKSGAKFAKDSKDWKLAFGNVKEKLQNLGKDGYKVVFFTNQAGIAKKMIAVPDFKQKMEAIASHLGIPVQILIATDHSKYRKPCIGMWEHLTSEINGQVSVNLEDSFYVGDAAGRPKESAPSGKRDHSNADRLFALNVGLRFFTPEEFFLGRKPVKFNMPEFDPRNLPTVFKKPELPSDQEVIIMVGGQGSGKSYYCQKNIVPNKYEYINRDKLGNWQKCIGVMEKALLNGRSVVVDNTNGTKEARKRYLDIARKFKVPARCFSMVTPVKHCLHNNKYRGMTDSSHMVVGDMVIYSFFKNFEEPDVSEGFEEIVKVSFTPSFEDDHLERLYKCFILES